MKTWPWRKIIYRIAIVIVVAIALLYVGVSWYTSAHQKQIIETISNKLKKHISGNLEIEDISISLLRDFPEVSIVLNNVELHDSAYYMHKRAVLRMKEVRVELSPLSVLAGQNKIRKLHFKNGVADIFTDSNGYSNVSGLLLKDDDGGNIGLVFPKIELTDIVLSYKDEQKMKLFRVDIHELTTKITGLKNENKIVLHTNLKIEECNFNTNKGSFLKGKTISGRLLINYIFSNKQLNIPKTTLKIDDVSMQWQGAFSLAEEPIKFNLSLQAPRVMFHEVLAMLSPSIASKLSLLKVQRPVDLSAVIDGKMKYRDTPNVFVSWKVRENELMTPIGKVEKAGFDGYYYNNLRKAGGHTDMNSIIVLKNLKATWLLIPFRADSIKIENLKQPYVQCNVNAAFPAKLLNPIIGGESFLLGNGNVKLDVNYKGRIRDNDSLPPNFNGYLSLENVSLRYLPRNLLFKKCNALLLLRGTDLVMKNVVAQTKKSTISMDGIVKNFFTQFYESPDAINIKWNLNSDYIDFDDFRTFLQPRKRKVSIVKNSSKLARNLEKVLDVSTVDLGVRVKKLRYREFIAESISADIVLGNKETEIQQIVLSQSGGHIEVSGKLTQQDSITNKFGIRAKVNEVNVQQLFHSFENFGQGALLSGNLEGVFSANVSASGLLRSKGNIVPSSMTGTLDFELKDGALVHFKPLEQVGKIIFKKRNLANITFKNITNTLTIDKDKVIIAPMLIESSALNMKVSGVFGIHTGTNISLEIPLRNPEKDDVSIDEDGVLKNTRGLILYLKAIDAGDGSVKITWDKSKGKH